MNALPHCLPDGVEVVYALGLPRGGYSAGTVCRAHREHGGDLLVFDFQDGGQIVVDTSSGPNWLYLAGHESGERPIDRTLVWAGATLDNLPGFFEVALLGETEIPLPPLLEAFARAHGQFVGWDANGAPTDVMPDHWRMP